jgi:hypothetical protein
MQPAHYMNTAFAFITAREQLKASMAFDAKGTFQALATALIALRRSTENEIIDEAKQLFGEHAGLEMSWILEGTFDDLPWSETKDGKLAMTR